MPVFSRLTATSHWNDPLVWFRSVSIVAASVQCTLRPSPVALGLSPAIIDLNPVGNVKNVSPEVKSN